MLLAATQSSVQAMLVGCGTSCLSVSACVHCNVAWSRGRHLHSFGNRVQCSTTLPGAKPTAPTCRIRVSLESR